MTAGKSRAGKLLEQYAKLGGKKNEEADPKMGPDGKPLPPKAEDGAAASADEDPAKNPPKPNVEEDGGATMNDIGEPPMAAFQKVQEAWGDDDEKKKAGVEGIKEMSESKHPMAKKFMEALDTFTSGMEMKKKDADGNEVNEDADGEYLCAFKPDVWDNLGKGVANFGESKNKAKKK